MTSRLRAALENEMSLMTYGRRKINSRSRADEKNLCFVVIILKFILNFPDLHVRNAGFNDPWESESFGRRIWFFFLQFSVIRKHNYDERQSDDWLHQKEAECTEWSELVQRQNPGGPHKSEVKEMILSHSQLLLVSYLTGRNGRRTGKITNTKSAFEASQKNTMIDCVEESA